MPTGRSEIEPRTDFRCRETRAVIFLIGGLERRELVRFGVDLFGQQHAHQRDVARPSRIEDFLSDPNIAIDRQDSSDRRSGALSLFLADACRTEPVDDGHSWTFGTGEKGSSRLNTLPTHQRARRKPLSLACATRCARHCEPLTTAWHATRRFALRIKGGWNANCDASRDGAYCYPLLRNVGNVNAEAAGFGAVEEGEHVLELLFDAYDFVGGDAHRRGVFPEQASRGFERTA